MVEVRDAIEVDASMARVWAAVVETSAHAQWHPLVSAISGVHELGAARVCDVVTGRREGQSRERCTTYEEGREIAWTVLEDTSSFSKLVTDWSAGFELEARSGDRTRVVASSRFEPRSLVVRLTLPLIRRKFHQAQRRILAGLGSHLTEN